MRLGRAFVKVHSWHVVWDLQGCSAEKYRLSGGSPWVAQHRRVCTTECCTQRVLTRCTVSIRKATHAFQAAPLGVVWHSNSMHARCCCIYFLGPVWQPDREACLRYSEGRVAWAHNSAAGNRNFIRIPMVVTHPTKPEAEALPLALSHA